MDNINKVGIILVNYNGAKFNGECIKSIKESTYRNYEIIVVDNASNDNSVELLEAQFKNDITIIKSDINLGFSEGNNLGIKHALEKECEFILLLNNDTTIAKDMIEVMVEKSIIKNNAVISPKIYYYDNPNTIWSAGAKMEWKRGIPAQNGLNEDDNNVYDNEELVEIATGCCLLFNKYIIEKVGLLSNEYFLYYEDTDFTTKIVRSGFDIVYLPTAKMYHKVSASTGGVESSNYIYYNTRNRLIFNGKYNKSNRATYIPYFYVTRIIKCIKWCLSGRRDLMKASIDGIKDYYNGNVGIRKS